MSNFCAKKLCIPSIAWVHQAFSLLSYFGVCSRASVQAFRVSARHAAISDDLRNLGWIYEFGEWLQRKSWSTGQGVGVGGVCQFSVDWLLFRSFLLPIPFSPAWPMGGRDGFGECEGFPGSLYQLSYEKYLAFPSS